MLPALQTKFNGDNNPVLIVADSCILNIYESILYETTEVAFKVAMQIGYCALRFKRYLCYLGPFPPRKQEFGVNYIPPVPPKSFLALAFDALQVRTEG